MYCFVYMWADSDLDMFPACCILFQMVGIIRLIILKCL